MTDQLPSHQLLDEYGLNAVTYQFLALVHQAAHPFDWFLLKHVARTEKITGNPAPALRKLVDRGLITGPARSEGISARRFGPTDQGEIIFSRIRRGLHRWEWITPARAEALKTLIRQRGSLLYSQKIYGSKFSRPTLDSLVKHGYVRKDFEMYRLTDLGREAWAEYLVTVPLGKGPGESEFPSPAGDCRAQSAGGEGR